MARFLRGAAGAVAVALLVTPPVLAKRSLRVQLILGPAAIKYINDNIVPEFERQYDVSVQIETVGRATGWRSS